MKIGDQIQVEISGGTEGVILGNPSGGSMTIGPGASMTVSGKIMADLGLHWEVQLNMSIGGKNIVNVLK